MVPAVRGCSLNRNRSESDEGKFNIIIAKLGREELRQVSDIIKSLPEKDKYSTLKKRLVEAYGKPSDDTLKDMWVRRLPPYVRSIILGNIQKTSLEELAQAADKISAK